MAVRTKSRLRRVDLDARHGGVGLEQAMLPKTDRVDQDQTPAADRQPVQPRAREGARYAWMIHRRSGSDPIAAAQKP